MQENNTQLLPSFRGIHLLNIQIGHHAIPLWYIALLLISGIGSGVLTYYAWPRKTTPSDVIVPDNDSLESCLCSCIHAYKFRYFNYSGDKLWNYPAGIASFNIPSQTDIAFGITLINHGESLVLNNSTLMDITCVLGFGSGKKLLWYHFWIVNVKPDGTITTPYTPITLASGEPKMLVFASSVLGDFAKVSFGSDVENLTLPLYLFLYGKLGSRFYGERIPIGDLSFYNPYT